MNQNDLPGGLMYLPDDDALKVIAALPLEVWATLRAYPQLFIVGGFIRAVLAGEEVKDIDIFTTDLGIVEQAVRFYIRQCAAREIPPKELKTPCTITVGDSPPVQFINNIAYELPYQCIEQVDFTICQAGLWHNADGWFVVCRPKFLRDVADKRLVYTAPDRVEAPGGSLWRATKFLNRGYTITQKELSRLVVRCVNGQSMLLYDRQCPNQTPDQEPDRWYPEQIERSFSLRGRNQSGMY